MMEPDWTDVIWDAENDLAARIYRPPVDPSGLVVDVHGGAWAARDRTLGHAYNLEVAAAGFTVVAIDFRDGRQARHPAAVDDVAAGVHWAVTEVGAEQGADPDHAVAITGSSSGGHLALHAALTGLSDPTGGRRIRVALVVALWPPTDPLARYRYARSMIGQPVPEGNRLDAEGLVSSTEAYFGDEATMGQASIAAIVGSGRAGDLAPVWLVEAGADLNVPSSILDELEQAYRSAGGELERTLYPGEIHGFGHGAGEGAKRFRRDLVGRLSRALGDS